MIRPLHAALLALLISIPANAADAPFDLADLDEATLRDEPVMFSVTDADSEVILFGTFHLLLPDTQWQSQALTDAIARADEAWFELPKDAQNDPDLQRITMELGAADAPLSSLLDDKTRAKLAHEAEKLGMSVGMLDQLQPWLAAITLPIMQMVGAGFDPAAGAEAVLEPRVEKLERRAFETAEQQLRILAGMDQQTQIEMLEWTLDELDGGVVAMTRMAESWAHGRVDMLEDDVVLEAKRLIPDMYDAMFTRRNAAWADRLDQELQGAGVDFVAVGAGHLLGPDSVPVMLADKGYDVRVLTTRD
ncbi:TraB/GumN family protein [uncultured Algimonas sp.]|uniref:TraB/GumN family protein n=1 Tax=uncultured Algimonas sp. TaxID=1547920 RepID=UPI00261D7340|nr:TraB/GumN family protein [uncultured Algimonas sp.]